MEQQDKRLENLHQQASTLYLQGEYVAALETWRQLLKIDPRDERAREGVHLCELLVQEEGGTVPPQADVPPPLPTPAAQSGQEQTVGYGFGEDLDEELDELDELLGEGASSDWMDKAPQQAAPAAETDSIEFDLSAKPQASHDEFNLEGADRPATREAESEIDAAFNFEASEAPTGHAMDATAEELQRRTDELMAEALEHYEEGRRAEALSVLGRLAILDERNEAATTFANHIRAEMEAQPGAAGPGLSDLPAPEAREVDSGMTFEPSAVPQDLLAEPIPEPVQPGTQIDNGMVDFGAPGGESLGLGGPEQVEPGAVATGEIGAVAPGDEFHLEDTVISEEGADPTLVEAPEPAAAAKARRPMNKWLMIAAVVLIVLGGAYGALQFFGGSDSAEPETAVLATPPPLDDLSDLVNGPTDTLPSLPTNDDETPPAATPDPALAADLDDVLDRGDAAYEAGDYADAVLAYNEALKIDPQNEVARRRLEEAGEYYREQKDQLKQRALAIEAFNSGDYRNALRIFYRLPAADEAEAQTLERYKFNGWFNMGLRALRGGDCRLARSNLREAQQVDPTDSGLQYAMELSGRCFEGQTDAYFESTRALRLRALDD